MTAEEYGLQVYHGDRPMIEEEVWDLVEEAAKNRDVGEIYSLLSLIYGRY